MPQRQRTFKLLCFSVQLGRLLTQRVLRVAAGVDCKRTDSVSRHGRPVSAEDMQGMRWGRVKAERTFLHGVDACAASERLHVEENSQ